MATSVSPQTDEALTCVCADVPFEIEGVVKSLPAKVTQVSLLLAVTFQVSVKHPLKLENFLTHLANISATARLRRR